MYILRLENLVNPGQRAAFEALQTDLYALASQQPGFVRSTLFNSLAYPSKYTRSTVWESREALLTFWASPAFQAFGQSRDLSTLNTPGAPIRAYEDVVLERQGGEYQFIGTSDVTVSLDKAAAYEESRNAFLQLVQREGRGVVLTGLLRLAGSVNGPYVLAIGCLTEADARATLAVPAIAEFQRAHPLSEFNGTATLEGATVVQVAVAARVAAR